MQSLLNVSYKPYSRTPKGKNVQEHWFHYPSIRFLAQLFRYPNFIKILCRKAVEITGQGKKTL